LRWIAEPQTRPALTLAFPAGQQADAVVLSARDLAIRLGGRPILHGVSVRAKAGDRILITGSNGAGKTTLLRILAGELAPDSGEVTVASPLGVLPQTHDSLRTSITVVDFLRSRVPLHLDDAEALLDGYQFGPDQWNAPLRTLSAGELRRLLLAVLVNSGERILVLDEPTNYLDFDAMDVVEEALRAYQGTLIIVTHDQYFAERIGITRTWRLEDATVRMMELVPA
jgi:ATPase subunit of ABC transporter with duplicated ATPase domains